MNTIVEFIVKHGYIVLFGGVFGRQIGLPLPAPLFLLAGGALAASGKLVLVVVLALGVAGCVLADWLWYEAGRHQGEKVLNLIGRFLPDPKAADESAREAFARFGPPVLVFDKFVPGLDAVAPPLAGTSGTTRAHFLSLETTGAALYSLLYAGLGYLFSNHLDRVAAYAGKAGTLAGGIALGVVAIYGIRKLARSHYSPHHLLVTLTTPPNSMKRRVSGPNGH